MRKDLGARFNKSSIAGAIGSSVGSGFLQGGCERHGGDVGGAYVHPHAGLRINCQYRATAQLVGPCPLILTAAFCSVLQTR